MSPAIADEALSLTIAEDMLTSWNRCGTDVERTHLVDFIEEMSLQLTRTEERIVRQAAILDNVSNLFGGWTLVYGKRVFAESWCSKFSSFGEFAITFAGGLEAQEDALAFLRAAKQLVSHKFTV
jgi:hypothetical protein